MNPQARVLLHSSNLWYFGDGLLGPLFAIFAERVGGSILDISWAWAIYLFVEGIGEIIIGHLSDGRMKKEKVMVVGYVLDTLVTFAYTLVSSPLELFIVQAASGVTTALTVPTWQALYAKHEDKKHAGLCWGLASGGAQVVTGIAIIVGGLIVTYVSFTLLFATMGVIKLCATVYQAQILYEK